MSAPLDLVLFGATGFVGRLVAAALLVAQREQAPDLRWALAGRSLSALKALRESLGAGDRAYPALIVADAEDEHSLATLCRDARVLISTVGPYARYGEALVRACVASGTDYCDLCGEPQWIRRMIDRYATQARASGARLVPCCGFDSIPSDLGVLFLQQSTLAREGRACETVRMRVYGLKGGLSGGTAASLINVAREAAEDRRVRRLLADPYALCPESPKLATQQEGVRFAFRDACSAQWCAPFIMAAINERVVHRSHALLGRCWGDGFVYQEAVACGRNQRKAFVKAHAIAAAMLAFLAGASIEPGRRLLERFLLPAPGEGPDAQARESGSFDLRFFGLREGQVRIRVQVSADRDPGYAATAAMLVQAALYLARDLPPDWPGGFWTPASLPGDALRERLQQFAGLRFRVLEHD